MERLIDTEGESPMELTDLDPGERTVLAAALRLTILTDHRGSEPEAAALDRIVDQLGQDAYENALDDAFREAGDLDSFADRAATVTRLDARELIYGTVLELAEADGFLPGPQSVLETMSRLWGIRPAALDERPLSPLGPRGA